MNPRLLLSLALAGLLAALSLPGLAAQAQKDDKAKDAKKDEPKKDEPKKDEKPKDAKKDEVKKDEKPKEDEAKKDRAALQGSWKVEKAEADGKAIDELKGARFTFKEDKVTVSYGNKDGDKVELQFTLDAKKKPREIDFVDMTGDKKESAQGIYELAGDSLKLCVAEPEAKKRPTEFRSTDMLITVVELKREK
jgi:uncharacterized protein (TIGR03067 family)